MSAGGGRYNRAEDYEGPLLLKSRLKYLECLHGLDENGESPSLRTLEILTRLINLKLPAQCSDDQQDDTSPKYFIP
jgi:hypothetical protein